MGSLKENRNKTGQDIGQLSRESPPKPTKWLSHPVMCGHCNFICCCSPSFNVKLLKGEKERINKQFNENVDHKWDLAGRCKYLKREGGCKFSKDRPTFCKMFPLQIQQGSWRLSNWYTMHCPTPKKFDFVGKVETEDGVKYHYTPKEKYKNQRNFKDIYLDTPIDELPPAHVTMKEEIVEVYGETYWEDLDAEIRGDTFEVIERKWTSLL